MAWLGGLSRVRGDAADPIYHGYTCPKGRALPEQHLHPERLLHSQRRRSDGRHEAIGALLRGHQYEAFRDELRGVGDVEPGLARDPRRGLVVLDLDGTVRGARDAVDDALEAHRRPRHLAEFEQDLEDEINGFVFDPASGLFTADRPDGFPVPLSSPFPFPPSAGRISTRISAAPASMLFSINSLATFAGRSTTSPAARSRSRRACREAPGWPWPGSCSIGLF